MPRFDSTFGRTAGMFILTACALAPLGVARGQQAVSAAVTTGADTAAGQMAEFERRRAGGFGHFLTQHQLDQHRSARMSEVLALLSGVKIKYAIFSSRTLPAGAYVVALRGQPSLANQNPAFKKDCPAAIMIDGTFVYTGMAGELPFDVNTLSPGNLAGVEFYSGGSNMPPEFNGTRNSCGLVVMWTRR
jgi:hypothetical protein